MQEQKENNIRKRNKALALIQNSLKQQLLKIAKVKEEANKKHTEIIETKIILAKSIAIF